MKKLAFLPLAALVFAAACADTPTASAPAVVALNTDGNSNGPTYVLGTFDLTIQGVPAGVNQHPEGKGGCRDASGTVNENPLLNTVWYNEQGKKTSAKFCEGSSTDGGSGTPGSTVGCTINGIPATYAAGGNDPDRAGNENLNFLTDVAGDDVLDFYVHYKNNSSNTIGAGSVNFTFACTDGRSGAGSLALTQFSAATNLFSAGPAGDRQLDTTGKTVFTGFGEGNLTSLYWVYRSRVGTPYAP
jgi:hypothetical protein